ncbi:MAG: MEDS domain-containing protein [Gammaproteobacteria bacterium]
MLARLIEEHLAHGAQVVLIGDSERMAALDASLALRGLSPAALESSGALRRFSVAETYLAGGAFAVERALAFVESVVLAALARGFERVLLVGCVDWIDDGKAADRRALLAEVMSYEERLNELAGRYPALTILCPYVLSGVDAGTIVDAFCVHPKLQFESHLTDGFFPGHRDAGAAGIPGT